MYTYTSSLWEKKKKLPREKNEFYVYITMIAEIRLAALLARATLLVKYSWKKLITQSNCLSRAESFKTN